MPPYPVPREDHRGSFSSSSNQDPTSTNSSTSLSLLAGALLGGGGGRPSADRDTSSSLYPFQPNPRGSFESAINDLSPHQPTFWSSSNSNPHSRSGNSSNPSSVLDRLGASSSSFRESFSGSAINQRPGMGMIGGQFHTSSYGTSSTSPREGSKSEAKYL